ncbi:MAG: hypothetical protein C0178_01045 [Sulfurihydrogenibium sp.]|nr:MAG: hypothetical protein C0178_01045 [Sulfurihydrogenibium sp.]
MKKIKLVVSAALLALTSVNVYAQEASSQCGCYDAPIGRNMPATNYVTKDYVDSQFAPIFKKLDDINSRVDTLSKELANMPKDAADPNLASRVNALESAINELKNTCPAECNAKLVSVEKSIAELKDKIEKRSQHMEKEVEKSMRK